MYQTVPSSGEISPTWPDPAHIGRKVQTWKLRPAKPKAFSGSVSEAAQVEPPQYFMGRWGRPQYVACFFHFSAGNRDILRIDSFLDVFSHTTWNTQMHFSISSRELNHRFQISPPPCLMPLLHIALVDPREDPQGDQEIHGGPQVFKPWSFSWSMVSYWMVKGPSHFS